MKRAVSIVYGRCKGREDEGSISFCKFARWQWRAATDNRYRAPAF